eukprot:gene468-506_t
MLPVIPFAKLPRKEWNKKTEKKERLIWKDGDIHREESESGELDESDGSSASSSEYDLLEHISNLMPEIENGKVTRKANDSHLQDLRVKAKPKRYLSRALAAGVGYIQGWRERERERRKHYIIKEFEERVRQYDELHRKEVQERLEAEERELKLEAYRREQRILRNSRKKAEKSALAESFAKNLDNRDKMKAKIAFYCEALPVWSIEGQRKKEAYQAAKEMEERQAAESRALKQRKSEEELERKQKEEILDAEIQQSKEIETMMIRYGTIFIRPKRTQEDHLKTIFSNARASASASTTSDGTVELSRKLLLDDEDEGSIATLKTMEVHLRQDVDLLRTEKVLRKQRFKRDKQRGVAVNPLDQSFVGSADVQALRGYEIEEVGAMSLAVEIAGGACAMLTELVLRQARIRDNGWARLVQAMRMVNLSSLRHLDLRGNFLTSSAVEFMREVASKSGVFQSLETLLLGQNELGDAGVEALARMFFAAALPLIRVLSLSWNSITDKGFQSLVIPLIAIQESSAPYLQELVLSNNLITAKARRELAPLPAFLTI